MHISTMRFVCEEIFTSAHTNPNVKIFFQFFSVLFFGSFYLKSLFCNVSDFDFVSINNSTIF